MKLYDMHPLAKPTLGHLALEVVHAEYVHVRGTPQERCARVTHRGIATPFVVTNDARHRLDAVGAEYADPCGQGMALVPPPRPVEFGQHVFTTRPIHDVQRAFDTLGVEADAHALCVQNRDTKTPSFCWTLVDESSQVAMQVVRNPHRSEGGDIVWGPPCERARCATLRPRPANVPKHRVIESVDELYTEDRGPFLFMGYGEGQDYRTSRDSLEEMARLGVTVIGVNLENAPSAKGDLTYADGDITRVLRKGTFFHLDTVFRPTPHGAFVFADALPQETLKLLKKLYGEDTVIPLATRDSVRFACNGRLLRKTDDTLVLFYKENALPRDKVEEYARAVGGTLHQESRDGYDVWVMDYVDSSQCTKTLRMVPVPTEEAWKGGGSFSCITQLVPAESTCEAGQVRIVMAPPAHYKPSPDEAINELERELIASLSVANAWREFVQTKARVQAEGFTVFEMPLNPDFQEQIYTRDGGDGYLARDGKLLDPALNFPIAGDQYLVWESNIPDGPRHKEPAAMSQELVNLRLGRP